MPVDQYEDLNEEKETAADLGGKRRFKEFDCPGCSANNPCDPDFGDGDEILCNYCGTEFRVKVGDDGRPRFRET